MAKNTPFILFILDGLANNPNPKGNAVMLAKKPTLDRLSATCPKTELVTWGPRVGLPEGQMGNSEVGHLNLGGGRIVKQELTKIDEAVDKNELSSIPELESFFEQTKSSPNSALHLIGLASTGGVHSSLEHLIALTKAALESGLSRVYIHCITDGRDRPTDASLQDVQILQDALKGELSKHRDHAEFGIVSMIGRYFAMDRDKRWERTGKALRLFTKGEGKPFTDPIQALKDELAAGTTDEFHNAMFLKPGIMKRSPCIQSGDSVLFFNFRADRMRQIVSCLLEPSLGGRPEDEETKGLRPENLRVASLTEYEKALRTLVLFPAQYVHNHLGEIIAQAGLRQLRVAETEKYAHVTYFFNGAVESAYPKEERLLVQSPKDVPTYDKKPEMSAYQVTEALLEKLRERAFDVCIINFANCDMVGHTGSLEAATKAVETVDECLGKILSELELQQGTAIVTADHGNADQMIDYTTGAPHTFHTMYPVPLFLVGKQVAKYTLRNGGALCDVAPTICELLGIEKPSEMTGSSLLQS